MIELIFFLLGFIAFLNAFFEKTGVWSFLYKKSAKTRFKLVYKLLSCHFCMMFHLCWIVSIPIVLFFDEISVFMLPFCVIGWFKLLENRSYDL